MTLRIDAELGPFEAGLLLAGRWEQGAGTAEVASPYTGALLARVQEAGPDHVERAMAAASAAFPAMRDLPAHQRAEILRRAAERIQQRREEFARTIALEAGKPITLARAEVDRAVLTLRTCGEEAQRVRGEVQPLDLLPGSEGVLGIVTRFPLGPVLGITPFNFPLNLVAHKVGPAIAAGCPIVVKPAPAAPLSALKLAETLLECGLPPEAISVLPCRERTVLDQLVEDERAPVVSFTGSASVGWALRARLPRKKVLLELGGNAAAIVHGDADLELAARKCAAGGFNYAGQSCISVQRIFVERPVWAAFVERFVALARELPVGDPLDERTVVGPLIDEAAAERVEGWIAEALAGGATALLRGGRRGPRLLAPTVLADVRPEMRVCAEEAFAPLAVLAPYDDFAEALAQVNAARYGLQAGLFTRDLGRVWSAYRALQVGGLLINEAPTYRMDPMPYGGVKDSGNTREGPRYAIEELTEPRLLVMPT